MKNKTLILISLVSFTSFTNALSYEVRGVERESQMFGDAICVSLYITNNSRNTYSFNIFAIDAKGEANRAIPPNPSDLRKFFLFILLRFDSS